MALRSKKLPVLAARVFAALIGLVVGFQLALALGAPWGRFAMGGAFPGALPPALRVAALAQAAVLLAAAVIVLSRAGLAAPTWRTAARGLIWVVILLLAVSLVLNLITPSPLERTIWAPIITALLVTALRVALGP